MQSLKNQHTNTDIQIKALPRCKSLEFRTTFLTFLYHKMYCDPLNNYDQLVWPRRLTHDRDTDSSTRFVALAI